MGETAKASDNGAVRSEKAQAIPLPSAPAPTPRPRASVKRGWGQNVRLTPADVKRAMLEYVQKLALSHGRDVPEDIIEFIDQSDLVFLDEHNERVDFTRVVITWDTP